MWKPARNRQWRVAWGLVCVGVLTAAVTLAWFRPAPRERARIDVLVARRLLDRGAPVAAEIHFRRALRTLPESARAWFGLARALLAQGRDEEGRAALDRASRRAPRWETVQVASAKAWLDSGDPDRALAALLPSFSGRVPSAAALRTRAAARRAKGDLLGSSEDLLRLADVTGEPVDALLAGLVGLSFADQSNSDGHRAAARQMLRSVVRGGTGAAGTDAEQIARVASAALSGDPPPVPAPGEAVAGGSRAAEATGLRLRGLAAFVRGDTAESTVWAARALRVSPASPSAMRLLAASALVDGRDGIAGRLARASGAVERLSLAVPSRPASSEAQARRWYAITAGSRLAAGFLGVRPALPTAPGVGSRDANGEARPGGPLGAVAHAVERLRASEPRAALASLEGGGTAPDARRLRAAALGSLGLWGQAVEALDDGDPTGLTPPHRRSLAHALVRAGDLVRAVDVVVDLLQPFDGPGGDLDRLPESGRRRLRLARFLERRGDLRAAAEVYRGVVLESPEARVSRLAFGACLLRAGRAVQVEREWARREEARPDDPVPAFLRGCAAEALGEVRLAQGHYLRAVSLDPGFAVAANNLAWLLCEYRNCPRQAVEFARAAVAAAPDDPRMADTLGWVLHRVGDHTGAVRALARAARGRPASAAVAFRRAVALLSAGESAAADAEWRRARALDPAVGRGSRFEEINQEKGEK